MPLGLDVSNSVVPLLFSILYIVFEIPILQYIELDLSPYIKRDPRIFQRVASEFNAGGF